MNVTILRKFVNKVETYHDICMILKQTNLGHIRNPKECSEIELMENYYLLKKINYKESKVEEIRIPYDDSEIISVDIG
jgi:hypothetical protein